MPQMETEIAQQKQLEKHTSSLKLESYNINLAFLNFLGV